MFENLSEKLGQTLRNWQGKGKLTPENIKPALKDIRSALLDADVALSVVKSFVSDLETQALGQEVPRGLEPQQFFIKLVNEALIKILGGDSNNSDNSNNNTQQAEKLEKSEKLDSVEARTRVLNLNTPPPAVILLAGLQGAGKTTLIAKLAKWIKRELKKTVTIATCDTQRAAAREQLHILAEQIDVPFFQTTDFSHAPSIAKSAVQFAKEQVADILLLDTAGRLHVDDRMMAEIKQVHHIVNPIETLFVVDSMLGQDAATSAKIFNDVLPLTGIVLTKIDGDARGGAALSVQYLTKKPIKFLSTGEKLDDLEIFYPERIASRILGMGDVLSLIEEIERKVDKAKADKLAAKIKKGRGFDLQDLLEQLEQMDNMGGIAGMMGKLPGMSNLISKAKSQLAEKDVAKKMKAVIKSATKRERARPDLIRGSRKNRIAKGSGTDIPTVNKVLKQHAQMEKMMKKMGNPGGMMKMMRGLQGMLPPGVLPPEWQ